MAEVSRSVRKRVYALRFLIKTPNLKLIGTENRLASSEVPSWTVVTDTGPEDVPTPGGRCKCQPSQLVGLVRGSLGKNKNAKIILGQYTLVVDRCLRVTEIDSSMRYKNVSTFLTGDTLPDLLLLNVACHSRSCHRTPNFELCTSSKLGKHNRNSNEIISITDVNRTHGEDAKCLNITPKIFSPSRVRVLTNLLTCHDLVNLSVGKKRVYPTPVLLTETYRKGRQHQRAFSTAVKFSERLSNSHLLPWKPRSEVIIHRTYSRKSHYGSEAPALYRSKTAYYDILQVSPSATQAQIKTAYYKQSLIYHPDKNAGSNEATKRFSEISEAYSILGSIGLRRKYDRGILSQADMQGAGRPSVKESKGFGATAHPTGRPRHSSTASMGGKPVFDFDAFYQAHYGEQLQRQKEMRLRKEQIRQKQQEEYKKWKQAKITEVSVAMLLTMGTGILISMQFGN